MAVLSVPGFGGGVVLAGSPDAQQSDELAACDGYDIGPRGQLAVASERTDYVVLHDLQGVAPTVLHGLDELALGALRQLVATGEGEDGATVAAYLLWLFDQEGAASPVSGAKVIPGIYSGAAVEAQPAPIANGVLVTIVAPPGIYQWQPHALYVSGDAANHFYARVLLINIGAREGHAPNVAPGLYVLVLPVPIPGVPDIATQLLPINAFDSLGVGLFGQASQIMRFSGDHPFGDGPTVGNTIGSQLYPRAIAIYDGIVIAWGADQSDLTNNDGPAHVMFSNDDTPLVWGNPDGSAPPWAPSPSQYADTDGFNVGAAGEVVRAGVQLRNRFYLGTSRGLHYMAGAGRDTFLLDEATPLANSENVLGPHAMIIGPDGLLHGVGDRGHWSFDGAAFAKHYDKLWDYDNRSPGWWDLIWSDPARSDAYPGKTNADLVWMVADARTQQVIIGIPHCDATTGAGYGTDTVLIKFHIGTHGYTRQVFPGRIVRAATFLRLTEKGTTPARFFAGYWDDALVHFSKPNIERFGVLFGSGESAVTDAASVTFGPYAAFGTEGVGMYNRAYLTLTWATDAVLSLPLVFTPNVDGKALAPVRLTIGPGAPIGDPPADPNDGDLWLDTSGTDTNIGNGTAGSLIPASAADYIYRRYVASWAKWVPVPGMGQQGSRVTLPIPFSPMRGTRLTVQCDTAPILDRFQIESFGLRPAPLHTGV